MLGKLSLRQKNGFLKKEGVKVDNKVSMKEEEANGQIRLNVKNIGHFCYCFYLFNAWCPLKGHAYLNLHLSDAGLFKYV